MPGKTSHSKDNKMNRIILANVKLNKFELFLIRSLMGRGISEHECTNAHVDLLNKIEGALSALSCHERKYH